MEDLFIIDVNKNVNCLEKLGIVDDYTDILNNLKILETNKLVKINHTENKDFDLNCLILELIKNKQIRLAYLNNISFDKIECKIKKPNNVISFRWNAFLKILYNYEKNNIDDECKILIDEVLATNKQNLLLDAFCEMIKINNYNKITLNDVYNLLSTASLLERTGWIKSHIPSNHLETIAEHMFNMYQMGSLYLPHVYSKDYDKNKILKMLLIHDVAETLTGDIPHPIKTEKLENVEDLKGKSIAVNLLYLECDYGMEFLNLWNEWQKELTINSCIAHDFDVIQLDYQFLTYAITYPNVYTESDIKQWMARKPKTKIGKDIYEKVILNNHKFKDIIDFI